MLPAKCQNDIEYQTSCKSTTTGNEAINGEENVVLRKEDATQSWDSLWERKIKFYVYTLID